MKNLPKILASGAVTTLSLTFIAPTALADTNEHNDSSRLTSVIPASVTVKQEPGQVILIGSKGEETILVDDGRTVEEVLSDADLESHKFHAESSATINPDQVIGSGETVKLYRKEANGVSEEVDIKRITIEEETDELYVGETEVVEEGKDGVALQTVITTSTSNSDKEEVEEKYTVLEQPEAKVIRVGTAEREVAPEPQEVAQQSNSSSSTGRHAAPQSQSSSSSQSSPTQSGSSTKKSSPKHASSSTSESGNQKIASIARAQLGKPYVWGATGPSSFDCSGLVQYVMKQAGKNVPRTTGAQWAASTPVSPANIQVGDILWRPGHIGIYVGDGKIVHASSPSTGTIETTLENWLSRGYKIGRL